MEQAALQVLAFISPWSSQLKRTPPAWTALEGQGRPQGVIGLGEDNFTIMARIGARY
jgi:hypothetical protein